ncbi:hypothetical protein GGI07_003951 [Coemansia sp. Benny D115]|nr:hypothetical protein GGI07_003951 [Coemansia sp. Benny D115]
MDRRGGKDANSFFSRIKDVDALRSPYPRHLGQPSRDHSSPGAASVRPIVSSSSTGMPPVPSSARPHYGSVAPNWHYPVPRTEERVVSPNNNLGARPGFNFPAPQSFRSPSNYASSVQPIRMRQHQVSDRPGVPGSTLPAHIGAGNMLRAPLQAPQPFSGIPCQLQNWVVNLDVIRGVVSVGGNFFKEDGRCVVRRSSAISRALDGFTLLTNKGNCYQLVGPPDLDAMRAKGLPEYLVSYFRSGFPKNWKQLIDSHISGTSNNQFNDMVSMQSPRAQVQGIVRPSPISLRHDESLEEFEADANPEKENPPASGFSGSTYANEPLLSETPTAKIKLQSHASSVYGRGTSLFANSRFAQPSPYIPRESPVFARPRLSAMTEQAEVDGLDADSRSDTENNDASEAGFGSADVIAESEDSASSVADSENTSASALDVVPAKAAGRSRGRVSEKPTLPKKRASVSLPLDPSPELSANVEERGDTDELESIERLDEMFATANKRLASAGTTPKTPPTRRRSLVRVVESSDESSTNQSHTRLASATKSATKPTPRSVSARTLKDNTSEPVETPTKPPRASASKTITPKVATPAKTASSLRKAATPTLKKSSVATTPSKPPLTKTPVSKPKSTKKAIKTPEPIPGKKRLVADFVDVDATETDNSLQKLSLRSASTSENLESSDELSQGKPSAAASVRQVRPGIGPRSYRTAQYSDQSEATTPKTPKTAKTPKATRTPKTLRTPSTPKTPKAVDASKDDSSADQQEAQGGKPISTPKSRRKGYFKYQEPATPTESVTRSGRKVRRPQDWWANAQDHLSTSGSTNNKDSPLKFKWGSIDMVVVKGGKRMRLSDYCLQGGEIEPLFADSADEKEQSKDTLSESS